MGVFRFKKFEVRNELSAMKVNTDGVLLGASATLHNGDRNILDIGTGTGTIALMLAQRYDIPDERVSKKWTSLLRYTRMSIQCDYIKFSIFIFFFISPLNLCPKVSVSS